MTEADILDYFIQHAPTVAVLLLIAWRLDGRLQKLEDYLCRLLEDCWKAVLSDRDANE